MLEYWYLFPVAVLFSTIAMATGIGGASMFTPFFLIVMRLPAALAVGVGLLIEVFGFSSGLYGFAKKKLIRYRVAAYLLRFTIPAAILGAVLAGIVPEWIVMVALAVLLLGLAYKILTSEDTPSINHGRSHTICPHDEPDDCYEEPERKGAIIGLSGLGGLLAGMVSTGVGEMNDYILLEKYEMEGPVAAGTSVFVVAVTVLIGTLTHAYTFVSHHLDKLPQVLAIAVFTVPGVLLGAQLGVRVSEVLKGEQRNRFIGGLFIVLAAATLLHAAL